MKTLLFDLESNGLLDDATKLHSLVIENFETGEVLSCHGDTLVHGLMELQTADVLVGHNIIAFDIPLIRKLYPAWAFKGTIRDTLVYARVIWPDIIDKDLINIRANKTTLPMNLAGTHKLEAWGHRVKLHKGDYAAQMEARGLDPWFSWNPEMQEYCVQDVKVTRALYELCLSKKLPDRVIDLEHRVADIVAQQERNGFAFNEKAARELMVDLMHLRAQMNDELTTLFPAWKVKTKEGISKVNNAKLVRVKGQPYEVWKTVVFNPNSNQHIERCLREKYKWSPVEFTPSGQAKLDEDILNALPYPEAKRLAEYKMIQKRLGQLAEGDQALLSHNKNGRIHGRVNPCGTPTARATHSKPNMSQLPKNKKPYGPQFRGLMVAPPGKKIVGCDCSGLELRMLAHYMARWDDGAYAEAVVNGDVHTDNMNAAGLPDRDTAKTFIYAFLYGAGNEKIGSIVGGTKKDGGRLKKKFLAGLPALGALIENVEIEARRNNMTLTALDGRPLRVRSLHSALNTLLQSAGAIVCKVWMVTLDGLIEEHGLRPYVRQVGWFHDELQFEVDEAYVEQFAALTSSAVETAGKLLKLRVPLAGDYKIGNNWSETH